MKFDNVSKILLILYTAAVVPFLSGCDTTNSIDEGEIKVKSDSELYVFNDVSEISLTIKNNSMNAVYYICSGDIYIEELKQGIIEKDWKVWGFEECLGVRSIESGEIKEFIFDKTYSTSPFNLDGAKYNDEVSYRFRLDFYSDESLNTFLSIHDRYSNRFKL